MGSGGGGKGRELSPCWRSRQKNPNWPTIRLRLPVIGCLRGDVGLGSHSHHSCQHPPWYPLDFCMCEIWGFRYHTNQFTRLPALMRSFRTFSFQEQNFRVINQEWSIKSGLFPVEFFSLELVESWLAHALGLSKLIWQGAWKALLEKAPNFLHPNFEYIQKVKGGMGKMGASGVMRHSPWANEIWA